MLRKNYIRLMLTGFFQISKKMHSKRNRMKSSWELMSIQMIHFRLKQEELELHHEIYPDHCKKIDYKKALSEFCDVAAFSLFGILHCVKEIRKEKRKLNVKTPTTET